MFRGVFCIYLLKYIREESDLEEIVFEVKAPLYI